MSTKKNIDNKIKDNKTIIDYDGYLSPYYHQIIERRERPLAKIKDISTRYGSLEKFASWHNYLGFHWEESDTQEVSTKVTTVTDKKSVALKTSASQKNSPKKAHTFVYREWAPGAHELYLIGDFNNWHSTSHPLTKNDQGIWKIKIEAAKIPHNSELLVSVVSDIGRHNRLPTFITCTKQNPENYSFNGVVWHPPKPFKWTDSKFMAGKSGGKSVTGASTKESAKEPLLIYEAHVGMATEEHKVGSYREFADNLLPYVQEAGYNSIQFMAVIEHPYYGSFGYHVSNLFAVSSRFGTPDDFKYLVDKAHNLGILVIMDMIHSHAVKNFYEGLNQFDGTDYQFFHEGRRGYHELWDSKLYNYGKEEVQRFLLSNLKFWIEEYHIDGFRFDGVTSMLYYHHGHYKDFVHYDMYFHEDVDNEALLYLQLANELVHTIKPNFISIAEDMSGMPGLCRPISEGGIGFDYRLAMGVPDNWIKLLKEVPDQNWHLDAIYHTLNDRRSNEKHIAYAESHDQALVGDKTIAFRLMDQEMYWHMNSNSESPIIDRGIALHKLIRFITLYLGGEGYLNFMGNEFGHPEWIDFPRSGNNFSYQYARRQWSLLQNKDLRYKDLSNFDKAMLHIIKKYNIINIESSKLTSIDETNKIIIFERAGLVFVISFNAEYSIFDYSFGVSSSGSYRIILCSDDKQFGGFDRIDTDIACTTLSEPMHGYNQQLKLYITNRTALILEK